ncbi:hypothetical protein FACS189474_5820 [Bacteroidia bacterium]|nr:hypothetical protein FACS189474_5820 [Bacteroidia bacterium]
MYNDFFNGIHNKITIEIMAKIWIKSNVNFSRLNKNVKITKLIKKEIADNIAPLESVIRSENKTKELITTQIHRCCFSNI